MYIHRILPGVIPQHHPLILLHRTGGDEGDLVDVALRIAPGAPRVALRGNVLEDGKPRFFRRLSKGQFDLEDLAKQTQGLDRFLRDLCASNGFAAPILMGFSNGANIALSLLLTNPSSIRAAILLRPSWTYEPADPAVLNGLPVLIVAGTRDTTVLPADAQRAYAFLAKAGADVSLQWADGPHEMTEDDESLSAIWLRNLLQQETES